MLYSPAKETLDIMSYFSSRSVWMSLVEAPGSFSYHPEPSLAFPSLQTAMTRLGEDWAGESEEAKTPSDLEALQNQRDLRHRLFFHYREWEFGPALFEDNIALARAQSRPQAALEYYEEARLVAKELVESRGQASFLPAWLETNRVLSEIYALQEQAEKSAFYAREGLQTLKGARFDSKLDPFITKLAVRFWDLLGRVPI